RVTDRLNAKLDFWRAKLPSGSDFDDHLRLFSHQSYEHILFGMGFESVLTGSPRNASDAPATPSASVERLVKVGRQQLPSHEDWLRQEIGAELPG
ncbi:MAG: hypothetical protein AAF719_11585, partial [Pseudomonadota bacterium]